MAADSSGLQRVRLQERRLQSVLNEMKERHNRVVSQDEVRASSLSRASSTGLRGVDREEERYLDAVSHAAERAERCWSVESTRQAIAIERRRQIDDFEDQRQATLDAKNQMRELNVRALRHERSLDRHEAMVRHDTEAALRRALGAARCRMEQERCRRQEVERARAEQARREVQTRKEIEQRRRHSDARRAQRERETAIQRRRTAVQRQRIDPHPRVERYADTRPRARVPPVEKLVDEIVPSRPGLVRPISDDAYQRLLGQTVGEMHAVMAAAASPLDYGADEVDDA